MQAVAGYAPAPILDSCCMAGYGWGGKVLPVAAVPRLSCTTTLKPQDKETIDNIVTLDGMGWLLVWKELPCLACKDMLGLIIACCCACCCDCVWPGRGTDLGSITSRISYMMRRSRLHEHAKVVDQSICSSTALFVQLQLWHADEGLRPRCHLHPELSIIMAAK